MGTIDDSFFCSSSSTSKTSCVCVVIVVVVAAAASAVGLAAKFFGFRMRKDENTESEAALNIDYKRVGGV